MIQLANILSGKRTVALGGHVRPDGDCVGSCMGLYLYLREQYPFLDIDVYLEKIPESFHILQGTSDIRHEISGEVNPIYDLFICLDCGDSTRLGFSAPLFEEAGETLCIDHHVSNQSFANFNYIVPDASSTCELVYNLLDVDKISLACAECLYVGMAHDTGVFQYACTAPETMEAAAQLWRKGVDGNNLICHTFYEKTFVQSQILGQALLESMLVLDRKCIVSYVTAKELRFFEAVPADLDSIVSQLRNTKGVEVAIFLYELQFREFKVSLRSSDKVDVSRVAKYFGGGGHVRAAGLTMKGTAHDVITNILEQVALQLEETS